MIGPAKDPSINERALTGGRHYPASIRSDLEESGSSPGRARRSESPGPLLVTDPMLTTGLLAHVTAGRWACPLDEVPSEGAGEHPRDLGLAEPASPPGNSGRCIRG